MSKPIWPTTPPPIIPVQGWNWRLNHGDLLAAVPHHANGVTVQFEWPVELEAYYQSLQRWLQLACFWYYVVGQPMVDDSDYEAVREAALSYHREGPDEWPLPCYWYWNHLPCRYDSWVKSLFNSIPHELRKPRYPWVYGERGIYNRPLDFPVQSSIINARKDGSTLSSGKPEPKVQPLGKVSFSFVD